MAASIFSPGSMCIRSSKEGVLRASASIWSSIEASCSAARVIRLRSRERYEVGAKRKSAQAGRVAQMLLDAFLKFLSPGQITVLRLVQELVIAGNCRAKLRHLRGFLRFSMAREEGFLVVSRAFLSPFR